MLELETEETQVTVYFLEMLDRAQAEEPEDLPANVQLVRAEHASPELARWLYGAVGGPWRWAERLGWTYKQWQQELEEEGSEIWLLHLDGTPAGYCQLSASITGGGEAPLTETEILYFGLMPWALGRGLGRLFLQHMLAQAWNLNQRHSLPPVSRVWVHTCTLDGEAALPNYRARGLEVYGQETITEPHHITAPSTWQAQFLGAETALVTKRA